MVVNKKIHKIRVRIQAFESKTLNTCCQKIISAVEQTNSLVKGPIPMPTKRRIYCVLRSPHVDKDSREHFEIRIHKRILEIYYDPEVSIFDLLAEIDLAPGIFYRICLS